MSKVFVVNEDDSISVSEGEPGAPKHESRIPEILKRLWGPHVSAAELRHYIAEEIALRVKEMNEYKYDPTLVFRVRNCAAQIKALSALEKILEKAARNPDGLFFGP